MWVENDAPMKDTLERHGCKSRNRAARDLARSLHSRFEHDADPQGKGCPYPANKPSSNRRRQQGFPDVVSKND